MLAGCPVFPADNIWNTPVDTLPLDANSAVYVSTIGASRPGHADFGAGLYQGGPIGIPFVVVAGAQPKVPVTFQYADESDPGPYPIPPNPPIEGGSNSTGDRHVLVLDRDNCRLYELFSAHPQPNGSWQAGSGAIFDLRSDGLRPAGWTSADAAGLAILPGLVRYDEVAAGEIRHAIRFTVPQTRREYVWPARHLASDLTGSQYPPMGQRFRLKASFNTAGFSPEVQVILQALKKYGMILADNGSSWFLSGAPDDRWNNDHLHEIAQLTGADFEAVNVSSLLADPNSGQVKASRPTVAAVVNAASFLPGPVAPGAIVTLFGTGIGPGVPSGLRLNTAGLVDNSLAQTRVLFDGFAAPLVYVSAAQVSAVVPYAVAGKSTTRCQVEYQTVASDGKDLPVALSAPALFTLSAAGAGQAAALNQDNSINSAANPAARGSVVSLYATGEGQTAPAGVDGKPAADPLPQPRQGVSVLIGGLPAQVLYAGGAPGLVAGVMQVNAKIPDGATPGPAVPVVLTVGGASSQSGVTLAVR